MDLGRLFPELKRRKVFRVAGAYAVVAWVLIEAADVLAPALRLPDWSTTLVVFLAILGLPVALVLAWAFEVTPEGVKRTESEGTTTGRSRVSGYATVVILLTLAGFGAYAYLDEPKAAGPDGPITSIAVLPFLDLSPDKNQEYFSDGIAEELLDALGQVEGLTVPARTSSFAFKDKDISVPAIARQLGVEAVLEGSVRKSGDQVRITAQLIESDGGYQLWSKTYNRRLTDVFAVQDEISMAIVDALRVHLTDQDRGRLAAHGTESTAAYDLYLRGKEYFHKPELSTAERRSHASSAITLLREALREDPEYAPAWAALGRAHRIHPDLDPEEKYDSAVAFARKAVSLDSGLADGYVELGRAYLLGDQQAEALEQFRYATELNPNHAEAIAWIGNMHYYAGRLDESVRDFRRAVELDPANWSNARWLGWTYVELGLFDRGKEWIRRAFFELSDQPARGHCQLSEVAAQWEGDPEAVRLHTDSALGLLPEDPSKSDLVYHCAYGGEIALGNYEKAKEYWDMWSPTLEEDARMRPWIDGFLAVRMGEAERGKRLLHEAEALVHEDMAEDPESAYPHLYLGEIRSVRGDLDGAVDALEQAIDRGYRDYYFLRQNPESKHVNGYPPFEQMMAELKSDVDRMRERVLREGW